MTGLRAAAAAFEPRPAHPQKAPQRRVLPPGSQMIGELLEIDSAYFDYGLQNTIRDKCLASAPWLWETGLPRDTMGLLTVVEYYTDFSLSMDRLFERNEYLEEQGRQADQTAELQCNLLRDQSAELKRLVSKGVEQAEEEASLQQQLRAASAELAQEQEAHRATQTTLVSFPGLVPSSLLKSSIRPMLSCFLGRHSRIIFKILHRLISLGET